jgi:hypothetical protein
MRGLSSDGEVRGGWMVMTDGVAEPGRGCGVVRFVVDIVWCSFGGCTYEVNRVQR